MKSQKPKPIIGKCDTSGCLNEWSIVHHVKATRHAGVDEGKKFPVAKLCDACWKR